MSRRKLSPNHPGEVLLKEFLEPMEISQYRLAKALSVPPRRINEIVHGKRSVTAESESVSVKVAACQALGRLGAAEASETLERLSQHASPALKRAAQHALESIRNAKPSPPS